MKILITKGEITAGYIIYEDLTITKQDLSGEVTVTHSIKEGTLIDENGKIQVTLNFYSINGISKIQKPSGTVITVSNTDKTTVAIDENLIPDTNYTFIVETLDGKQQDLIVNIPASAIPLPEIETSEAIINTDSTATSSLASGTQTRGDELYINFTATISGGSCTIEPTVPYKITKNGTYKFIVTGELLGRTKIKEVEVNVEQYKSAPDLVKYDAGDWTKEEIEALKNDKLYDLNKTHTANEIFKLKDDTGLNFTFGGFTYKGDTANQEAINSGDIITSKNQSVSPQSGWGTPQYDGWQIFTKETKTDDSGNIIKNSDGTDRIYVTKLIHAGAPENFVFHIKEDGNLYRAEYLLSSGLRQTSYKTLASGELIKTRNWDNYKDQKQIDLIEDVHCMTQTETQSASGSIIKTGSYYWLASANSAASGGVWLYCITAEGSLTYDGYYCWGIRPVVTLKSGVYIASGTGTESDPYILAKE